MPKLASTFAQLFTNIANARHYQIKISDKCIDVFIDNANTKLRYKHAQALIIVAFSAINMVWQFDEIWSFDAGRWTIFFDILLPSYHEVTIR